METTPSKYHSYLLRMWQVPESQGTGWRASLEDVQTGELKGFQDLNGLIDYLQGQVLESQGVETDQSNL